MKILSFTIAAACLVGFIWVTVEQRRFDVRTKQRGAVPNPTPHSTVRVGPEGVKLPTKESDEAASTSVRLDAGKHWYDLPDSKHHAIACVDKEGQILGIASEKYPNLEPGQWYAEVPPDSQVGSYVSRLLAMRRVEHSLAGCPGITPIEPGAKRVEVLGKP